MLEKGAKIGDYTLLKLVGSGGFADVWKAEKRTALDVNYYALKFFRPKDDGLDFEKINKEMSVWKQLKALPYIISVNELDQFEDYVYVVSDFADEGSLENLLKSGKEFSVDEAVRITLEILTGLESLHDKGFIHRDLKPDNIVIMNSKHCLTDFGISREMKTHSVASCTAGTFEYMPPEAFDKTPSISAETDIWAAGVIFQQLLTGKLPYPQEDQPSLIAAILMSDPEPLPKSVPENLRAVIEKALMKDRADRFKSASEMRQALKNLPVAESAEIEENIQTDQLIPVDEVTEITDDLETKPGTPSFEESIHISNGGYSHEKIISFDHTDADVRKALAVYQSLDASTDPKLDDAIREMREKGIVEMKKHMDKVTGNPDSLETFVSQPDGF